MGFQIPESLQAQMAVYLLVLVRLSGLFAMAPFFTGPAVPGRVKILLAAGISICIAPLLRDQGEAALLALRSPVTAALTVLTELFIGLTVGFLVGLVIGIVQTAGYIIAQDVGMTIANIIDPLSNQQTSVLGQLKTTVAVIVFLLMDFHLHLIRLLASSFEALPLGSLANRTTETFLGTKLSSIAGEEGSFLFSTAVQMAMPVTITLILVTVAMAFLARAVPEMNVFIIGFAIRILVGFTVVVLMFPYLQDVYESLFSRALREGWDFVRFFSESR